MTAICVCATGQTYTENFVKTEDYINDSGGKVTTLQYYDGLGRPTLNVTNSMGNGNYVYVRQQYDYGDRMSEVSIRAYGNSSPVYAPSLTWLYSDTHRSTTFTYDALDRPVVEKGPGDIWHSNNKFKRTDYILNGANEVKLYTVTGNTLSQSSYYGQGKLTVKQSTDENDHVSKVYTDMQGRTVMERRINGSTNYDTYYVYDYLGNLRYVIPPKASASMSGSSWTISSTTVKQYCYYYEYDSRGRCTKKQLPGCDYMTMTYDTDDRLITSQDGNQRQGSSPTTTYYEYDTLGRQTVMGIKYPSGSKIPLLETFYDDYTFLTSTEISKVGFDSNNGYESTYASAKGLQTGSRVHHLGNPSTNEVTTMYYNAYGEMIQQRSTNHLSGNDDNFIQYNHYTGKELYRKHIHSASGQTTHTEVYTYEYDTADQLHYIKHKLDNNSQVTLSTIIYDDIGRVASKGSSVSTQTYSYNIRDWVKKIENSLFKEYIGYNETSGDAVPTNKSYNGNIGAIKWKAGGETTARTYQFSYNNLDWLTSATYSGPGSYSTTYSYDKMGNMLTLTRYGKYSGSTYQLIDNLTFSYTGNQVTRIDDSGIVPSYSGAFNFVNGVSQSGEYTYDKNGNLTKDLNKNISSIQYNLLNLPSSITYSSGKSAAYIYDATGRKLRVSYKASASATAVPTDYCGNMIYENGVLKQILVDGGYMTVTGTPFYFYYLKDHLGSNRVVVSPAGTATQVNHYYPFGGLFGESTGNTGQRYKYNGKELDRTHGLDWYDYGARHMTPDVGRFTTIDPMAEKYYSISPYAYCGNNPINAIDTDGNRVLFVNGYYNSLFGIANIGPTKGYENYWSTNFVNRARFFFGDNSYIDYRNFIDGSSLWGGDKSGSDRYNLGMKYAKEHYSDLTYNLGEDEPINIVTHSEGAAYGAGIAQYLINQGIKIKTVLHLSADEGDEFSTPKEPYTIQFSYDKDWITGNHFINGSDIQIINKMYNGVDGSWQYVHGQTNNRSVFDLIEKALREKDSEKDKIIYSY